MLLWLAFDGIIHEQNIVRPFVVPFFYLYVNPYVKNFGNHHPKCLFPNFCPSQRSVNRSRSSFDSRGQGFVVEVVMGQIDDQGGKR